MSTTYINGTPGVTSYTKIQAIDLPLGRIDTGSSADPIISNVLGVDVPLGRIDVGPGPGSLSDRAPNVPSGYDIHGDPTYGDGEIDAITEWAEDRSGSSELTKFSYNTPIGPESKLFSDLT